MEGEGDSPTETEICFVCTVCEKTCKQKKSLYKHLRSYHNIEPLSKKEPQLECKKCEKKFSSKTSIYKHLRSNHNIEPLSKKEPQFECETCEKIYTQKKSLYKHLRSYHNIEPLRKKEPQFKCEMCEKLYSQKRSLIKHLRSYHNIEPLRKKDPQFQCERCDKIFIQKRSLVKHLRSYHNIEPPSKKEPQFECETCKKKFSSKSNLKQHAEKFHGLIKESMKKTRLLCCFQECDVKFMNHKQYRIHLQKDHKLNLETKEFCFGSIQEFEHWKKDMESQSLGFYTQDTAKRTLANGNVKVYYNCHRSIKYKSKKRAAKSVGSNKINKACPARLDVEVVNDNSKVIVKFYKTHCGHETQIGRIMWDKNTKAQIAEKHKEGVTFEHILDSSPRYITSGKESINKKFVNIMELLKTTNINNEYINLVENKLDQVIDILNEKKTNFSEVQNISIQKQIKKQAHLLLPKRTLKKQQFSTKKKTAKMNNFKKPLIFKQGALKAELNNPSGEAVNVTMDEPYFEHIYIFEY